MLAAKLRVLLARAATDWQAAEKRLAEGAKTGDGNAEKLGGGGQRS